MAITLSLGAAGPVANQAAGSLSQANEPPRVSGTAGALVSASVPPWWAVVASGLGGVAIGVLIRRRRKSVSDSPALEPDRGFRAVFDSAYDSIFIKDSARRYLLVNPAMERLFGVPASKLIGHTDAELFGKEPDRHIAEVDFRVLAGETVEEEDTKPVNGVPRTFHVVKVPIRDSDGNISGLCGIAREITERKRGEQNLRETTERMTALIEEQSSLLAHAKDFVYRHNASGLFTYVSPSVEQITGYAVSEWHVHYAKFLTDHPVNSTVRQRTEDALRTGQASPPYLVQIRHRDGHAIMLEVNEQPYFRGESVRGLIGVARDVTERVEAERTLRESKDELQALYDGMVDGALVADSESGRFVHANSAICSMLGYSEEELLTMSVRDIHPPEALSRVMHEFREAATGERRVSTALAILRKGGSVFYADVGARLIRYRGRECAIGFFRDITEQRRAAEELSASEQRFRLVTQATDDAIYDWDIISTRSWRNARYRELFSGAEDEPHEAWVSRLHEDDRPRVKTALRKALDGESEHWLAEYRMRRPDGTVANVVDRGWILRDDSGRAIRVIGAMTDTTERVQAEELARQRRIELGRVARLSTMGEMAAGLAHELNQPLAAIAAYAKGCTRRIRGETVALRELLEPIERIAEQAGRAGHIIRHIRGVVTQREPDYSAIKVDELLRESVELADYDARSRQVRIKLDVAPNLPPITGSRVQLQQVLINLLRNAADAMADNDPDNRNIHIQCGLADPGLIEISVRDSGSGIPQEAAAHLFDAFFTTRKDGMGMGLAICRSIINEHRGRLWVTPNPDRGVAFRFTLPITPPHLSC